MGVVDVIEIRVIGWICVFVILNVEIYLLYNVIRFRVKYVLCNLSRVNDNRLFFGLIIIRYKK